jgi:hypothetical protein
MTRAERAEAAKRLRELAHEIYDTLEEMEAILEVVAPEELELVRAHWMAYVDGALLNLKGQMKRSLRSLISLKDTLEALEEEEVEEW